MFDPTPTLSDELAARLTARHREHVEQLEAEIARLTRERDLALRYQAQDMRDMAARLRAVEAERDEARELAKAALAFGWYVDGEPRIGAASRLRQRIANLGKEAGDGARQLATEKHIR